MFKFIWQLPRMVVVFLIKLYQKTLSLDHGILGRLTGSNRFCKYYPSCSEYSKQSVEKHGLVYGGIKAAWRILRCNPWSDGGEDEV